MQAFQLMLPALVKVIAGKMAVSLPVPAGGPATFLIQLDDDQLAELDRQADILKWEREEVLKCIFTYGFNSMETFKNMLRLTDGAGS